MSIEISKPFGSYVVEEKLPKTDDSLAFRFILLFEIEGTNRTEQMSYGPWRYTGTQEAIDTKAGVDGLKLRRQREMATFCRAVEAELAARGERLYEKQGQRMLIRGPQRMKGAP